MEKHCLFIDDNPDDVESVLENLKDKVKRWGLKLKCDLLKITSEFYDDNYSLDLSKIEEELYGKYMDGSTYDLVACDFDFEDDDITGLDIVKKVRQRNRRCDVVIYSGRLDKVATHISKIGKQIERFKQIKTIVDCKIHSFIDRPDTEDAVIGILKNKVRLETIIENKLKEHGKLKFRHGFKKFEGKTLMEIASEIENDSFQGIKFKQEIVERGIAHMIELNLMD